MKNFPVTIVDNFYECPELVRHFALSQEFYKTEDGKWPGARTSEISNINLELFKCFCEKLFGLFFNFNKSRIDWNVETSFQMVDKFSDNKDSKFNEGWIHSDPCIFSGIVYLSYDDCGTSVYEPKKPNNTETDQKEKFIFYSGKEIDEKDYEKSIIENNNRFTESIKINSKFNRLVMFEGGIYHGVPSFYTENEPRLTQVFFVRKLNIDGDMYPISRSKCK